MAVIIRKAAPEELWRANEFFNRIYGTTRSDQVFEREFMGGPCGPALYILAIDDTKNQVVGIQCAIPLNLIDSQGNTTLTAKSEDTLVDPNYRGQKIFERMYELLFKECAAVGIKYIWGFTYAVKPFDRLGFSVPYAAGQTVAIADPAAAYKYFQDLSKANKLMDRLKLTAMVAVGGILPMLKGSSLPGNARLVQASSAAEALAGLSQVLPSAGELSLEWSEAFLHWRLFGHPSFQTLAYQLQIDDQPQGLLLATGSDKLAKIEAQYFAPQVSETVKVAAMHQFTKILLSKYGYVRGFTYPAGKTNLTEKERFEAAGHLYLDRGISWVWYDTAQAKQAPPPLWLSGLFTQG